MVALSVSPHEPNRVLVAGDMLGIGLSLDGGQRWQSTFGMPSYEMADFTWHPKRRNIVWVGSMSGPLLSEDGGKNWKLKRGGFPPVAGLGYSAPIEKILINPTNDRHLLAFGGSSRRWDSPGKPLWGVIWESRDGGENWKRVTTVTASGSDPSPTAEGINIVAANYLAGSFNRLLIAVNGQGVYGSSDTGKTWKKQNSGLPNTSAMRLVVHPKNPKIAWVSLANSTKEGSANRIPGGVYKSLDGGITWSARVKGLSQAATGDYNFTAHYDALAVAPSNPDWLLTGDAAWNTGIVYLSKDGAETWKPIVSKQNIGNPGDPLPVFQLETAMKAGMSASYLTFDPNSELRALFCNSEIIAGTRNGGKTWSDLGAEKLSTGAWVGRGYTGWCSRYIGFDPFKPGRSILQAMDAARAWVSEDGMKSWRYGEGFPSPWFAGTQVSWTRSGRVYGIFGQFGGFQGVGRSDDGGRNWTVYSGGDHGLPDLSYGGGVEPVSVYSPADRPDTAWFTMGNTVYETTNKGESWKGIFTTSWAGHIVGDPKKPGAFYLLAEKGVYRTEDGRTFTNIGGPKPALRGAIDSAGRLYVTSTRNAWAGLYVYELGKWKRLLNDYTTHSIAIDPSNPDRLAVTTSNDPFKDVCDAPGMLLSSDRGRTWSVSNNGLPVIRAQAVAFDPFASDTLVVGTFGRGFFKTNWPKDLKVGGTVRYESTAADDEGTKPFVEPTQGKIVIKNPSFEAGSASPNDWSIVWSGKGSLDLARDTSVKKSGNASLRLSAAVDSQGQAGQTIEATAGTKFTLSGWVRSKGGAKINLGVQSFGQSWNPISFQQIGFIQGDTEWTQVQRTVELPAGTTRFNIVFLLEGVGTAWLDDLVISQ